MPHAKWLRFIAQFAQLSRRQRQAGRQASLCCAATRHTTPPSHCLNAWRSRIWLVPPATAGMLTGTPLARLRHKSLWLAYADCLLASVCVRQAARQLNVHRNTAFRWRHRFLTLARTDRPLRLHGIAEADELYLLESEKGSRHLARPARRRGGHARQRGISNEQVCILVARDRTGQTLGFVTGKGALQLQLQRSLLPVMDHDVLLVTDGHAAYRAFAAETGISHQAVNLRAGIRVRGASMCRTSTLITAACAHGCGPFTAWRRATCRIARHGAGSSTPGASARQKRY